LEEISRLKGAGPDLPLPVGLGEKLRAIGPAVKRSAEDPGAFPGGDALPPLPLLPVPVRLQERLRAIPTGERGATLPSWVFRSRDLLAASCLLALLLTVAMSPPPPETIRTAAVLSRGVVLGIREAGVAGTRTLVGAGALLSLGMDVLNRTMGGLMGRLGPQHNELVGPTAGKAPPAKVPLQKDKENSHGKRPPPRSADRRG
jgi:hypothetical protein